MSSVTVVPEFVGQAADQLESIGWRLREANAAATAQISGALAPAADEVSTAITAVFGTQAQAFQALSAQATAFHDEFVNLLSGGAMQYLNTEIANAEQMVVNIVNAPAQAGAAAHPAAFNFWQSVSNFGGWLANGEVSQYLYRAVVAFESNISGLAPLNVPLIARSAAIGTEIGEVVFGTLGSFFGPEGTVLGVLWGGEIGGVLGGLAGKYGPGVIVEQATRWAGVERDISSFIYNLPSEINGFFNGAQTQVQNLLNSSYWESQASNFVFHETQTSTTGYYPQAGQIFEPPPDTAETYTIHIFDIPVLSEVVSTGPSINASPPVDFYGGGVTPVSLQTTWWGWPEYVVTTWNFYYFPFLPGVPPFLTLSPTYTPVPGVPPVWAGPGPAQGPPPIY